MSFIRQMIQDAVAEGSSRVSELDMFGRTKYAADKGRAFNIAIAAEKKRAALEAYEANAQAEDNTLRAEGMSEKEIQQRRDNRAQYRKLTPEARLARYVQGYRDDKEFVHDIENEPLSFLQGVYGNTVSKYAYDRAAELNAGVSAMAAQGAPTTMGTYARAFGTGILSGINSLGSTVHDLTTLATKDGEEQAQALQQSAAEQSEAANGFASLIGSEATSQRYREAAAAQLAERYRQQRIQEELESGATQEEAIARARSDSDQYLSNATPITGLDIAQGLGEQVPQLALGAGAGKVGATAAKAAGGYLINQAAKNIATRAAATSAEKAIAAAAREALEKSTAGIASKATQESAKTLVEGVTKQRMESYLNRKLANQYLEKAAEAGSMAGIGAEAGLQDGSSAYTDAYNAIADTSSDNVEKVKNSPAFKQLKQQHPEMSDRDIQLHLAEQAGQQAFKISGGTTALSAGVIGSSTERLLAGTVGKAHKAITGLTSPITEGASEYAEEYVNNVAPKQAVNDTLGMSYYDDPKAFAANAAKKAGVIAFASGGIGMGAAGASIAKSAISPVVGATTKGLTKVFNKATDKMKSKADANASTQNKTMSDDDLNNFVNGRSPVNSTNTNTTSNTKEDVKADTDTVNQTETPQSHSDLTQAINKVKTSLSEDPEYKSVLKTSDNGDVDFKSTVNNLLHAFSKAQDEEKDSDQKPKSQKLWKHIDTLTNSINQSIAKSFGEIGEIHQNIRDLQRRVAQDPKFAESPEFQDVFPKLAPKLAAAIQTNKSFSNLLQSEVVQKLNDTVVSGGEPNQLKESLAKEWKDTISNYDAGSADFGKIRYNMSNIVKEIKTNKLSESEVADRVAKAFSNLRALSDVRADIDDKAIEDVLNIIKDLSNAVQNSTNNKSFNTVTALGQAIDSLNANTSLTKKAKLTALQKVLGGGFQTRKGKQIKQRGLLDYLVNPNLSASQLSEFKRSQLEKTKALLEAQIKGSQLSLKDNAYWNPDEEGNNQYLTVDGLTNNDGKPVKFEYPAQLAKYIRQTQVEEAAFDDLAKSIMDFKLGVDGTKSKSSKPNTENKSTDNSGSENKSKPEPKSDPEVKSEKDTKAKKEAIPVPEPEVNDEVAKQSQKEAQINAEKQSDAKPKQEAISKDKAQENASTEQESVSEPKAKSGEVKDVENTESATEETTDEDTHAKADIEPVKVITKSINTDSKDPTHSEPIRRKLVDVLEKSIEAAKKGNLTSDQNIRNRFGFNKTVSVSIGGEKVNVPSETLRRLRNAGLDLERNLVAEYTTNSDRQATGTLKEVFDIVDQDGKVTDEQYQVLLDTLASKGITKVDKTALIDSVVKGIKPAYSIIKNSLLNAFHIPLGSTTQTKVTPNILSTLNANLNFLVENEDGEIGVSEAYVNAITDTALNALKDPTLIRSADLKPLVDSMTDDGKYDLNVEVFDTTHNIYKSPFASSHNTLKIEKVNLFTSENMKSGVFKGLQQIGSNQSTVVEKLGKQVLINLGLKLKGDTPSNVANGIVYSLGTEVLNQLIKQGLVTTYDVHVYTPEGSNPKGNKQVMRTVNFTWDTHSNGLEMVGDNAVSINKQARALNNVFKARMLNKENTVTKQDKDTLDVLKKGNKDKVDNAKQYIDFARFLKASRQNLYIDNLVGTANKASSEYQIVTDPKEINFGKHRLDDSLGIKPTGSKSIKDMLDYSNHVAFKLNPPMVNLFHNDRTAFNTLMGWLPEDTINNLSVSEREKDKLRAKADNVVRSEEFIEELVDKVAQAQEQNKDSYIVFKHTASKVQRISPEGSLHPQANKIIREITHANTSLALSPDTDNTDQKEIMTGFDASVPLPTSKEPRSVDMLIKQSEDKRYSQKNRDAATGLILAISQAAGIKVEKLTLPSIKKQFQKVMHREIDQNHKPYVTVDGEGYRLPDIADLLYTASEVGKPLSDHELNVLQAVHEKAGTGTPRLANALLSYAQYMHSGLDGKSGHSIQSNLYLEADGITNGGHNLIRQFSSEFNAEYFSGLIKTGYTYLNQILHKLPKLANKLAKGETFTEQEKEQFSEEIQKVVGSQVNFEEDGINDVYQTVSNSISEFVQKTAVEDSRLMKGLEQEAKANPEFAKKTMRELFSHDLTRIKDQAYSTFKDTNLFKKYVKVISLRPDLDKRVEDLQKLHDEVDDFTKAIVVLQQLSLHEDSLIQSKSNPSKTYSIAGMTLQQWLDNRADFKLDFKRGLAKLGVTPVLYGGGSNAISSGIWKDLKVKYQEHVNNMIGKLSLDPDTVGISSEEAHRITQDIYNNELKDIQMLRNGLALPSIKAVKTALDEYAAKPTKHNLHKAITALNEDLDWFATQYPVVSEGLKHGLSEQMTNAIKPILGQSNDMAQQFNSYDTEIMQKFNQVFLADYHAAIEERNKRLGYKEHDPRVDDSLDKATLREILRNNRIAPVVGTAYSENDEILESLMNTGNHLTDRAQLDLNDPEFTTIGANLDSDEKEYAGARRVLYQNIQNTMNYYARAGAKVFTGTIMGTESKTQYKVLKALGQMGYGFLNVFDGMDAHFNMRQLITELGNKFTDEVHKETSLPKELFNRIVRANLLEEWQTPYTKEAEAFNDWIYKQVHVVSKNGNDYFNYKNLESVIRDLRSNKFNRSFNLTYADMYKIHALSKWDNALKQFIDFDSALKDFHVNAASGELTVDITKHFTKDTIKFSEDPSSPNYHVQYRFPLTEKNLVENIEKYRNGLVNLVDLTANNMAMRDIESDWLTYNVNQFGGSGSGYLVNKDNIFNGNPVVKAMAEQFAKANNDMDLSSENMATQLEEFINHSKPIQAALDKSFRKHAKELNTTLFDHKIVLKSNTKINTVNDLIEELNRMNANDVDAKMSRVLADIVDMAGISKGDTKVFNEFDDFEREYRAYLKSRGLSKESIDVKAQGLNARVNGMYVQGVGIYINPNSFNTQSRLNTMVHEIVHSITQSSLDTYFSGRLQELVKSGDRKAQQVFHAIKHIENNLLKWVQSQSTNHKIIEAQNILRNRAIEQGVSDFRFINLPDKQFSTAENTIAQLLFAYNTDFLRNQLNKSNSEIAEIQNEALGEALAYTLTEANMLNDLMVRNTANVSMTKNDEYAREVLNLQGNQNNSNWNRLLNHYNEMVNKAADMLGIKDKRNQVIHILGSVNILAQYAKQADEWNTDNAEGTIRNDSSNLNQDSEDYYKTMVDSSGIDPTVFADKASPEHIKKLAKLSKAIADNFNKIKEYPEVILKVFGEDSKREMNNLVSTIHKAGFSMSKVEEDMYKLLFATFKANLGDSNFGLNTEASKWVQSVIDTVSPKDFKGNQYNTIFNNPNTDNNIAHILAAAMAVESIGKVIKPTPVEDKNIKDKFSNLMLKNFVYKNAYKAVEGFHNLSTLEQLAWTAAQMDFRNIKTSAETEAIIKSEQAKEDRQVELAKKINETGDKLPETVGELAKFAGHAMTFGKGVDTTGTDTDSTLGAAIQEFIDTYSAYKGKNNLVSTVLRWVLQARQHTNYIYAMRNESAAKLEAKREQISNIVPTSIRNRFETELNEEHMKAIALSLPAQLNNIQALQSGTLDNIGKALVDEKVRQSLIKDAENNLEDSLKNTFKDLTASEINQIKNYLIWQSKGLGELKVTRQAKGIDKSHFILPNSRAISALKMLPPTLQNKLRNVDTKVRIQALDPYVGALSSLHSLEHLDSDTKTKFNNLISTEPMGIRALFDEMSLLQTESVKRHGINLLGTDGFVHKKSDPMIDLKVVRDGSDDFKKLQKLGYKPVEDLDAGMVLMKTNVALHKSFQSGVFGLAEMSVNGTDVSTNEAIGSKAKRLEDDDAPLHTFPKAFMAQTMKAMNDSSYYDKLKERTMVKPVIDYAGNVEGYSVDLPSEMERNHTTIYEDGFNAIGNYYGRLAEEDYTRELNKKYVDILNQEYKKSPKKNFFIKFDGDFQATSNRPADVAFAKKINSIFFSLPVDIRDYIEEQGGVYLYRNELDNLLGYSHISMTDALVHNDRFPEPVRDVIKGMLRFTDSTFGDGSAVKTLKVLESGIQEVVALGKEYILNRSGKVALGNAISNTMHLWNAGVPAKDIIPNMRTMWTETKRYMQQSHRLVELEHVKQYSILTGADKSKVLAEIKFIKENLSKSPIHPLIEAGIMSSVSGQSQGEIGHTSDDFKLLSRLGRRITNSKLLSEPLSSLNKSVDTNPVLSKGKAILDNVLVRKDSKVNEFMVEALDYGDFVAKAVLYQHLVSDRNFSSERAMNLIREEFVNYSMNRGALFDFMNKNGIAWFLNYALGIQKVIYRNLRKNFLRSLATVAAGRSLSAVTHSDLFEAVPENIRPFGKGLGYQFSPSNTWKAFESHWLHSLL